MCPSYMVTQGGDALDPRAHAPALRDAPGRPDEGGLEERDGEGVARPLPGVQGVPHRVPDERGHGHVQGRVPLALLRGAAPAPARLRDGPDLLVGAAGLAGARGGEPGHPRAGRRQGLPGARAGSRPGGRRRRSPPRRSCRGSGAGRRGTSAGRGWCSGPTRSTTTSTRRRPRRPSRCSRRPGSRSSIPREVALLRPAALRLRHARHGQGPARARSSTRSGRRSRRARRSSAWSRAAWPSSATR